MNIFRKFRNFNYYKLRYNKIFFGIIFISITVIGLHLLFISQATGPYTNAEAESGVLGGGAAPAISTSANGGKYVQYPASSNSSRTKPVFIIYYLWWDKSHWTTHLGANYPLTQTPNPLPANLDSTGCGTVNNYTGNELTDISQNLVYDQSNYQTVLTDVEEAAATGATGFAVNWVGTGTTGQTESSSSYDQRLAYVFQAVHAVNAKGIRFKIMFNYQSSANILTMTQFSNDFNYLISTYGNDSALDHTYSNKPEIIMAGTWKYTDADIQTISQGFRSQLFLIGDEKPASWDSARATYLDGTSYYWSSQDPYNNAASFSQLVNFAATVRSTKNPDGSNKVWLAPFTPGYNATLLYGTPTCVPRDSGQTMHTLFDGNLATNPDGWTLISWNEISEGSYIVPLTRYGNLYTNTLSNIISTGK